MGGFDDHVAIVGDWLPPSPSPRAFFSSMMGDDNALVQSIPNSINEDKSACGGDVDQSNPSEPNIGGYDAVNENTLAEPKQGSRGGLMDRIAARAGFNAPRLNTESIRPTDLSKNSGVQSPYLTIPPGLSPTTLLDSPVFVNNSLVQPSPTTGKFSFATSGINQSSTIVANTSEKGKENAFEDMSSFAFKPNLESGSISFPHFSVSNKAVQAPSFALPSFPSVKASVHSDTPPVESLNFRKLHGESRGSNLSVEHSNSVAIADNSPPLDEPHEDSGDPNLGGSQGEDGFNWRKYGQKQVKGSEFPRSYYKCTHPNCTVKKKVERSLEGHITEIIYKGNHNHPKPPPNRRSSLGSSNDVQPDPEPNGDPAWSAMQIGNNFSGSGNWSQENVEATASVQEYNNNNRATFLAQNGSADGVDGSCTFSNDEDDDDRATHGSVSLGYNDGEGDELESKRRKIEAYSNEMSSAAARAIREPRVVVQTTSEVDILDDGYRWRKYGQKVVKGNPNPRSYYKCTSPGCNVRKHVERASHDLKSVITTYEGKHNHDVPAARNSSHVNTTSAPPVSNNVHRPEPSHLHRAVQRPPFGARPQMGPGFGFGLNQPGLTMQAAAMGHNPGNFSAMQGHPFFGQGGTVNDVGFMMPKAEPKMEPVTDSGGSGYQQVMNRIGPPM